MTREYVHIINRLNEEDGGPVYALISLVVKQKELKNKVSIVCTYDENFGDLKNLNKTIKYLKSKKIDVYIYKSWSFYSVSFSFAFRIFKINL